jgi:AcrR family transcriptional regulator
MKDRKSHMAKSSAPQAPVAAPAPRDRIIDALMKLAADNSWNQISLPMVAEQAGVSLSELRDAYPSKGAILGGFARRIDKIVLDGTGADMLDQPMRERLLDIMMRRLDAVQPYKAAFKSISKAARQDPLMLAALNQLAINSWRYMLAAADIETEDELGLVRIQGAAVIFVRTLETWFEDDGADLSRTMARLDKELAKGEKIIGRFEDVRRLLAPFRGFFRAAMESGVRKRHKKHDEPHQASI